MNWAQLNLIGKGMQKLVNKKDNGTRERDHPPHQTGPNRKRPREATVIEGTDSASQRPRIASSTSPGTNSAATVHEEEMQQDRTSIVSDTE